MTYEVRVFSRAGWRTLVGKYGPVAIVSDVKSLADARDWAERQSDDDHYCLIFDESGERVS